MGAGGLGVGLAVSIYTATLLFFGTAAFDDDFSAPTDFFDLFTEIGDLIGDLTQFLTLTSPVWDDVNNELVLILQFALGLSALLIIMGLVRGGGVPS